MNIHNISTISRYETKLLRRSWLFRIFAILSLLVIVFFHMGTQSNLGWFEWVMVAMPSSIPFVNIYLFNIAQSVIAIFLAGSFLKRDKKLDTAEVIYVRPMSNADYIVGKTWGIICPVPLFLLPAHVIDPVTDFRAGIIVRGHEFYSQSGGDVRHHAGIYRGNLILSRQRGARGI